jgi:hypothetical protein
MGRHVSQAWVRCSCVLMVGLMLSACLPGLAGRMLPAGRVAPDVAVEGMDGTISLSELRGSVVVLVFWSST